MRLAPTYEDFAPHAYTDLIRPAEPQAEGQLTEAVHHQLELAGAVARTMSFSEYSGRQREAAANGVALRFELVKAAARTPEDRLNLNTSPESFFRKPEETVHDDATEQSTDKRSGRLISLAVRFGALGLAAFGANLASADLAAADNGNGNGDKMSSREVMQACDEVRQVTHLATGSDGVKVKGPPVDSLASLKQQYAAGVRDYEFDIMPGAPDKPSDATSTLYDFHDKTVDVETTNGHGVFSNLKDSAIRKLRLVGGYHVTKLKQMLSFASKHKDLRLQAEFKEYGEPGNYEWSNANIDQAYSMFAKFKLLARTMFTSGGRNVLTRINEEHPEFQAEIQPKDGLQNIGLNNELPNPETVAADHIPEVNVDTFEALTHPHWVAEVEAAGIDLSVRSKPNGVGDDGKTWYRELTQLHVAQIVKQFGSGNVCTAVANFMKHGLKQAARKITEAASKVSSFIDKGHHTAAHRHGR